MSIRINCHTVVIPKTILESKFIGGFARFKEFIPNQTFQEDNELVSVSFMSGNDVEWFINIITNEGLSGSTKLSKDFVIISVFFGCSWKVEWLDRDGGHCWFKGALPTHTNPVELVFKEHRILDESDEDCRWWNNLSNAWKNILYHNYRNRGEKQSERLHNLFYIGYKMQFIGDFTKEEVKDLKNLELIRVDAMSCKELGEIEDLEPIKKFSKLKEIILLRTSLKSLRGIENFPFLKFIQIEGNFSDLFYLNSLVERSILNINSPNVKSVDEIYDVDTEFLNINSGYLEDKDSLYTYKKLHAATNVVIN